MGSHHDVAPPQRPRIVLGSRSRHIYVATRWRESGGIVVAEEFYDVTNEVLKAVATLHAEMNEERRIG